MTRKELLDKAMKEWEAGNKLSKNLTVHRERYMARNKDKIIEKSNKDLDKLKTQPKIKGNYPELSKEELDKLKIQPKLEGNYPSLSEEELDKLKKYYRKGGLSNSRIKTADYRKGGMVLSTMDNRRNK